MDLLQAVQTAGVIGAGGAGFPTHVKLAAKADVVIVNGVECEPLLHVDQELMATRAEALALGMAAVLEATGIKAGVFALKNKYHRAEATLLAATGKYPHTGLFISGDFYPAGDEHVLVHEVTGRTVPPGGIPPEVGAIVLNVETLLNVALAATGVPVTTKYVTVTGAVKQPGTFGVPVGVSFQELLSLAGGTNLAEYGLIDGGSLMGRLASPADPVMKTTNGLLVLPRTHSAIVSRQIPLGVQIRRSAAACCNCRMCTDLCPRYLLGHPLEPHRSLNAVAYGQSAPASLLTQAYLCSECGICDVFACPMGLSPRQLHVEMKRQLAWAGIANPYRGMSVEARRERDWRRIPTVRMLGRLGLTSYNLAAPLRQADIRPERVLLPLRQGVGAPSQPLVKAGDYVNRGQCIAEPPAGKLGSRLHASIDGRVVKAGESIEILAI